MGIEIAEDPHLACRGMEQSGQDAQQRRFARAIFAEQNIAAARREIDRDLAQRSEAAEETRDRFKACDWPSVCRRETSVGFRLRSSEHSPIVVAVKTQSEQSRMVSVMALVRQPQAWLTPRATPADGDGLDG